MDNSNRSTGSGGYMPTNHHQHPQQQQQQQQQQGYTVGPNTNSSPQQKARLLQLQQLQQQRQQQSYQQRPQQSQPNLQGYGGSSMPQSPSKYGNGRVEPSPLSAAPPALLQRPPPNVGVPPQPPLYPPPQNSAMPSPSVAARSTSVGSVRKISSLPMASKSQKPTTTGMIRQTSMTSSTADNPKSSANPTPFSNLKAAPLSAMTTTQTKPNTGNPVPSQSQPSLSDAQMQSLLNQCDWKDKTLWLSRQLFGGQSVNGFLRSTATVQRIKKQRARQVKLKSTDDVSITSASVNDKKRDLPDQVAEEALKQQVMNARTAKKLKAEMDAGLKFCALLHGTVRSILQDMNANAGIPIPPVLGSPESAAMMGSIPPPAGYIASQQGTASGGMPTTSQALKQNRNGASQPVSTAGTQYVTSQKTTASPGNPNGSTLRKNRKKKLPRNTEPVPVVSEFNAAGKRVVSKKEHQYRLFEALRFRALRKGDFVAARVSSRDLWILASVLQEYPGPTGKMDDFLQLSEAKRDQVFRNKVVIKDVEDKGEMGTSMISRNLVLPLPRSFSEAADWGQRCKKGSRLYAMYPETTSLYTATVMDNTTYCRGDDDIIVVEFDGDEPDVTGQIPKCHIPARFVTLIPREFSGSEPQATKKANSKTPQAAAGPAPALPSDDPIASLGDFAFDGFGDFDDMDFDLGFGA